MSKQLKAHDSQQQNSSQVVDHNPMLEEYLDHLGAPLAGLVHDDERLDFLAQARVHLEQSIAANIEKKFPVDQATMEAIMKYGKAEDIATEYLDSWYEGQGRTAFSKRFGRANLVAYSWFQTAVVLYLFILQIRVFIPSSASYQLPWSPAYVRQMWPEPLPFPDFSLQFYLAVGYPILAPILAGWIAGRLIPARASRACYHAMMPLILLTFVIGALLLPATEGLLFGLFQVAFWLPAGCISAYISSALVRRKRIRNYNTPSKGFMDAFVLNGITKGGLSK